jgi:hypothetical protein
MKKKERLRRLKELQCERSEGTLFKSADDCMVWIDKVAPLLKHDQEHYGNFLTHARIVRVTTLSADLIMSHLNSMSGIVDQAVVELENKIELPAFGAVGKVWHDSFWGKVLVSVVAGIILIFVAYLINKFILSVTSQNPTKPLEAYHPPAAVPGPTTTHTGPIKIGITKVPQCGSGEATMGTIAGSVQGIADLQKYRVVVYAFSDDVWYIQPQADQPFTMIQPDGSWSTDTHLGSDYASLVVRPTFQARAQCRSLPGGVDVIAITRLKGRQPANTKGGNL